MGKKVLIFVLGALVGGASGFLGGKYYFEKKFSKISEENEELKEYLDFLRSKDEATVLSEDLGYASEDEEKEKKEEKNDDYIPKKTDYTRFYSGNPEDEVVLNKVFGSWKPKSSEEEEKKEFLMEFIQESNKAAMEKETLEEEMASEEHPEEDEDVEDEDYELERAVAMLNGSKKVEVIDADEYDLYPYYDKVTLRYYTENGILTTENNEELDDPEAYIGSAIQKTGFDKNKETTMFVRNHSRGTDYEIGKIFGGFPE